MTTATEQIEVLPTRPFVFKPDQPKYKMFDFVLARLEEEGRATVNKSGYITCIAWDKDQKGWVYELDSEPWGCGRWDERNLILVHREG